MKQLPIVAGILALILTVSVAGTLNPAIMANAQEDEQDREESNNDEREQEERSSDARDDEESDDEQDDSNTRERDDEDDGAEGEDGENGEFGSRTKVSVEDDGLEIELEIRGLDLENGSYDVILACVEPTLDMTLENRLEVDGGKGEFEVDVELSTGNYSACKLQIKDTGITLDVGSFAITGEDDEQTRKRQEDRKREIVESHDARETHDRHRSAQPASPGEYEPGTKYMLVATGTAEDGTSIADAHVNATLGVWKSVRSLVLLDVLDGTVTAGDKAYTIRMGYAIYSENGEVLRMRALATDDATGDIVRLSLRGGAEETAELPKESGQAVALTFEGNSGTFRNEVDGWELRAEGYVEAA